MQASKHCALIRTCGGALSKKTDAVAADAISALPAMSVTPAGAEMLRKSGDTQKYRLVSKDDRSARSQHYWAAQAESDHAET